MVGRVLVWSVILVMGCAKGGLGEPPKRIALSFDDVPRKPGAFFTPDERARRLVDALDAADVDQAAFFVTTGNLDLPFGAGGEARIDAYVAAGHVIANHSHSHDHLSEVTAESYVADLDRAEVWLRDRPGRRPWYRFPYLDEGRADRAKREAVRAALAERGLRNAYVTIDAYDWHLEQRAADAVAEGRAVDLDALRDLYVESHVGAAAFYDGLARRTLGRSPAHVLLLHETDLAALFVADLADALRADGWELVPVDEAYADPIGTAAPDVPSAHGTLVEMLAWESGYAGPRRYERNRIEVADALFDARVLGSAPP